MSLAMNTTFWIQVLGLLFGLAMLYFTFLKLKRKEINRLEAAMWTAGWIVLIIIAIVPYIIDPLIAPLHFYRRLDFFVVSGFFILLAFEFYNYNLVQKNRKEIERIVKAVAAKNAEQKMKEKEEA